MKKKTLLLMLTAIVSVTLVVSVFITQNDSQLFYAYSNGSDYSMIFDKYSGFDFKTEDDGKPTIFTRKTSGGNDVRFISAGMIKSSNFGLLKEDNNSGQEFFFSSLDHIYGLKQILVNYTASDQYAKLELEYSYTHNGNVRSDYLTSGNVYNFYNVQSKKPNYFKLYAYSGDIDIESIVLTYSCEEKLSYFPGYLNASENGDTASVDSQVYLSAGTRAVVVPSTYNGLPIASVATGLFQNDSGTNLVAFPKNSVFTTIPTRVCSGCFRLSYAIIPSNVTHISSYAFYNCSGLKTIIYEGTLDEWNAIVKDSGWNTGISSSAVVYTDSGDIYVNADETEHVEQEPIYNSSSKTITYGIYPQTRISNTSLLGSLDSLDDSYIEENGWYLYNGEYYAKEIAKPKANTYLFNDGDSIVSGETYWFKCEPILWDVYSTGTNNRYNVLSRFILDDEIFNVSYNDSFPRSNNYYYSHIRDWLNNDFLSSAFSLGSTYVLSSTIDNSASTTDATDYNEYACQNSVDKITLLSYQDYRKNNYGFDTTTGASNTRVCKTTDYARAKGVFTFMGSQYLHAGCYWTRSPDSSYHSRAWGFSVQGAYSQRLTSAKDTGVRPAATFYII